MSRLAKVFALASILLGTAALAAAQAGPPLGPNRQNVRENIITLKLLRLTQALDLSEEQTAKLFPLLNKVEKDKLKVQKSMSADLRALRQLVRDPAAKEDDISVLVKSILEARLRIKALDDEADELLDKNLNPTQRGKYLLFQVDFYQGLGDTLQQIRQMRRGQQPPVKK
jgi:Spy/CpxP family protein refolding chaperone